METKHRQSCSLPFNVLTLNMCSNKNCFPRHWLLEYVTKISFLKRWSSATDVIHTFASVWLVMIQNIYNTFNFVCAQINWSPACPRSVYQHIHEIKSTLNITYLVNRWLQDTGISMSVLLLIIPPSHIILWYCDMYIIIFKTHCGYPRLYVTPK
jgi:hypothetical protein